MILSFWKCLPACGGQAVRDRCSWPEVYKIINFSAVKHILLFNQMNTENIHGSGLGRTGSGADHEAEPIRRCTFDLEVTKYKKA